MLKVIRVIALSLVVCATMFACKKGNDGPSNGPHMTAKFDGESKAFSTQVFALKTQMMDGYNLTIAGLNGTKETFHIDLTSDMGDFHAGDVFYEEAEANGTYNVLAWTSDMMNSNETTIWTSSPIYLAVAGNIKVTITEINNDIVKGTFSGTIYQNIENPASHSVTGGEFVAKFQH